jgi:hypothetical protein
MMSPSAAPDLADQFHQFRHLNALQRAHRSLNVRAQALVSAAAHKPFESEFSTAGEVVGVLEDLAHDACDIVRIKRVGLPQLEYAEDGRLRGDGVALEREPVETIQSLCLPVDADRSTKRMRQPVGSLDYLCRTAHAAGRQQRPVDTPEGKL